MRARHPSYCDNSTTPKPRPPQAPAHLFIKLITPPLFQVSHPASPSEPRKKHPTGKASAYPLHPRDFVHRASLECAKHARNVEAADRGCGCRKSSHVNRFSDEKTEEKPWLTSHFLLYTEVEESSNSWRGALFTSTLSRYPTQRTERGGADPNYLTFCKMVLRDEYDEKARQNMVR